MKKIIYLIAGLFIFSACQTTPCDCKDNSNGFVLDGQSVTMGSEATVDLFKKIDAAWLARDYETMKSHISDGGNFRFYDGTVVTNAEDFVAKVEEFYQEDLTNGIAWEWNTDYAFAVQPTKTENEHWNEKGDWINAQFTGPDGKIIIEWYQFDGDQLISWTQTVSAPVKE
tara:strand:+ start:189 stop:698 length:510 start_codon:yes stop_codon:yes gene_type:complete